MPLHLSKVAVGCLSIDHLRDRNAGRAQDGVVVLDTRFRPTRAHEVIGGSLFWIIKHRLVGRQEILGFDADPGGRCLILLDVDLVPVAGRPKRAHQGWRYLDPCDAPPDLTTARGASALPSHLLNELAALALV